MFFSFGNLEDVLSCNHFTPVIHLYNASCTNSHITVFFGVNNAIVRTKISCNKKQQIEIEGLHIRHLEKLHQLFLCQKIIFQQYSNILTILVDLGIRIFRCYNFCHGVGKMCPKHQKTLHVAVSKYISHPEL